MTKPSKETKLFGTNNQINESIDQISEELNFPIKPLMNSMN
jgi:hypothetical protein